MLKIATVLSVFSFPSFVECSVMEPFIVGGMHADISKFPHSVFLNVLCVDGFSLGPMRWICGASIINEKVVMTAAHCLADCNPKSDVSIAVGHSDKKLGAMSSMFSYLVHHKYDSETTDNDIALVRLKTPLKYNENVKRVALMQSPPYNEKAYVAGWGMINEQTMETGDVLTYIHQRIWSNTHCRLVIRTLHPGAFCASSGRESYSSRGDSGSALIVRGYIQIGIVSYKVPKVSRDLVVYTDIGYFYNWITTNSKRLYCV